MRNDEILEALTADVLTALGTPESLGVGRILPSVGGEDFLSRDIEGQLPAVGVAERGCRRAEEVGIGSKRWRGDVTYDVSVAVSSEGEGAASGRDVARGVWGLIDKALDYRSNPYRFRFKFVEFEVVPHPRQSAVVLVATYTTSAFFGNE